MAERRTTPTEDVRYTKNGIPVYSYRSTESHGFFISMFLRLGSMYETRESSGITHLLEHILIRNINRQMQGRLYPTLDRYGLEFNASTYSEMVQLFVSGAARNYSKGAEIITRALAPLCISSRELEAERARVKAEIRESDDRSSLSFFTLGKVFEGTSLALPITGTPSSVNKIGLRRLERYRKENFHSGNIFFYVSGCVSDGELDLLCSLIDEYEIPKGACRESLAPMPRDFGKRGPNIYQKNSRSTKLKLSFDLDFTKLSIPVCDLLYDMILGADSSPLFVELSEERGLFYDLGGGLERYPNLGVLGISYELRESKVYEALLRTVELLRAYKERLPLEEECMKAGYVDNAPLLLDDTRELNFTFAYENHILGVGYPNIEARAKAYSSVTPEQIRSAAKEIFRPENLTLTVKCRSCRLDLEKIKEIINRL